MSIFVLDDFHPFPESVRQHALEQEFIDWDAPDGETYRRIAMAIVPGLHEMLEGIFGKINMLGAGYRLNYNDEEPNSAIHSDLFWGTHALVLYLGDGDSGTAFWQHKETGAERIDVGDIELFKQVVNDWNDESKWIQTRYVPMKFNRAVIYESALFHSRYPFKAFGDSPETGRLIAIAFFTPEISHDSTSNAG